MFKNSRFDFIGKRKIFFTLSCVMIAVILFVSIVFGVKMDIQFKGGSIVTYAYEGQINETELKQLVESTIKTNVKIDFKQGITGKDSFSISLTDAKGLNSDKLSSLTDEITNKYGEQVEFLSNSSVDPIIGKEFFYKSMVAVFVAALILIIYIGFRFKNIGGWSAGVMAVIALLHDVIIVFGVFVIFRMPLDYNFVAVILTILGYSINDTIVIYDRIRENEHLYGKKTPLPQLVNDSINQTMSRTINTSLTTMTSMVVITVVAFVTGLTSIISFSFPLLIGLLSGTYSSLFVACPLWVMWQGRKVKKTK